MNAPGSKSKDRPDPSRPGSRIAIIGNMNNNGFAIMRYFRDLGADAWLLPYATDAQGASGHFAPEADSWQFANWQQFIRPLPVPNTTAAIVGRPARLRPPPSKRRLRQALSPYDRFVGSGVAPALFERLGARLDIFFPYSNGIELYGTPEIKGQMARSSLRRRFYQPVRRLQARGIRNARYCLNSELSLTRRSFEEIGKPFLRLGVPMVYNREPYAGAEPPRHLRPALSRIRSAGLSLFCSARQMWIRPPGIAPADWPAATKNSDWLFRGLAEFVRARPRAKPLLTIVEYGPDVDATKALAAELGLTDYVQWLPVLPRREIMLLLGACDIGVGEFYTATGMLWGGTGWEALACGRPLLQAFNFPGRTFIEAFGHPPPPILDSRSPADIARHLCDRHDSPGKDRETGRRGAQWFDAHGGIGLARQWLALVEAEREPGA